MWVLDVAVAWVRLWSCNSSEIERWQLRVRWGWERGGMVDAESFIGGAPTRVAHEGRPCAKLRLA